MCVCVCVCVYLIKYCKHFFVYISFNPFKQPYRCYNIRLELAKNILYLTGSPILS